MKFASDIRLHKIVAGSLTFTSNTPGPIRVSVQYGTHVCSNLLRPVNEGELRCGAGGSCQGFDIETKVAMSMEGNETLRVILIPRRGRIISH